MSVKTLILAAAAGAAAAVVVCAGPAVRVAYAAGRASMFPALTAARRAASTDVLTGVANRAGLLTELGRRVRGGDQFAVLLVDLDGFKAVNDTYGHTAGDQVLTVVAGRLSTLIAGAGLVARLGGDEFVLLATSPVSVVSKLLGHDVARAVARPINLDGRQVVVRASVGVVHALPGDGVRSLLRSADIAMYRAKSTGGGAVVEYDEDLADVDERPAVRLRQLTGTARTLARAVTR